MDAARIELAREVDYELVRRGVLCISSFAFQRHVSTLGIVLIYKTSTFVFESKFL